MTPARTQQECSVLYKDCKVGVVFMLTMRGEDQSYHRHLAMQKESRRKDRVNLGQGTRCKKKRSLQTHYT